MANERALRNLKHDITRARGRLKEAREDGRCESITVAARRLDELLDRYSELARHAEVTAL